MSSHRGDGIFNPKPIPDLAGDPAKLKISRDPKRQELEKFIHGLITQEFDGPEPPPAVLDAVAAYVRSMSPRACKGPASVPVRLGTMLDDVAEAVRLAEDSFADGDEPTGRLLIGAARSMLGMIDERFQVPAGENSRRLLREADSDLKAIELANTVSAKSFEPWRGKWAERVRRLRSAETRSLFSESVVRRQLGKR
jgi:hypothetical protein